MVWQLQLLALFADPYLSPQVAHDVNPSVFANGGKLTRLSFHVLKLSDWFR